MNHLCIRMAGGHQRQAIDACGPRGTVRPADAYAAVMYRGHWFWILSGLSGQQIVVEGFTDNDPSARH